MSRIITRDSEGRENGWLIPLWNALERPDLRPEQVYLTVVKPGTVKGPHLHLKRRGLFCVVRGCVTIVFRDVFTGAYVERLIVPGDDAVQVEPGSPCAIYNGGTDEAYVINLPTHHAWSKEDPDDWPVEGWKDPEWWKAAQEEVTCSLSA